MADQKFALIIIDIMNIGVECISSDEFLLSFNRL
jgi:hypothetical protein